jgi:hypothetical protein
MLAVLRMQVSGLPRFVDRTAGRVEPFAAQRIRSTVVAWLITAGVGGSSLTIPSLAVAFPGNPGIPTNPGSLAR